MLSPTAPFRARRLVAPHTRASLDLARKVWLADQRCYPAAYRASWGKILYLCAEFPEGVQLYEVRSATGWQPAGYAAWHPFDARHLVAWPDILPIHRAGTGVYLFNYSVVPELIGSPLARALMQGIHAEVHAAAVLAAETVSDHGARAAARWGMHRLQTTEREGAPWTLWARGSI